MPTSRAEAIRYEGSRLHGAAHAVSLLLSVLQLWLLVAVAVSRLLLLLPVHRLALHAGAIGHQRARARLLLLLSKTGVALGRGCLQLQFENQTHR